MSAGPTIEAASDPTTEAEWAARCDLAALYRVFHHLGIADLIFTHLTARVPGSRDHFLINRYGEMFDEITASGLVCLDMTLPRDAQDTQPNKAGFAIHKSIYRARPDVGWVIHTHSRAGVKVSATAHGLQAISQDALEVIDDVAYHDYGVPDSGDEEAALAESCRRANCVVLRNHGLLAMGDSAASAFIRMYFLERACEIQAAADAMREPPVVIEPAVQRRVAERMAEVRAAGDYGALLWAAMRRMLERAGARYAV